MSLFLWNRALESGNDMRKIFLVLLAASMLSACTGVTIGPVDFSCPGNPNRGDGTSGCAKYGHG